MTVLGPQIIAADDDDGGYSIAGPNLATFSTIMSIGRRDAGGYWESRHGVFARFTNITVPKNSTINSATWEIAAQYTGTSTIPATVTLEAGDNPAAPTSAADARGRTRTSGVTFDMGGTWDSQSYHSVDITSLVQALVNRTGWVSGNAVLLFWDPTDVCADGQERDLCDITYGSAISRITIDYTASGGTAVPVFIHQLQEQGIS